jgi:hypothetical protein
MSISSIVSRVIPAAVGFVTGGPVGAFTAAAATESAKRQERQVKRQIDEYNTMQQQIGGSNMAIGDPNIPGAFPTMRPANLSQPGFFDRLGGIASNVGNTLLTGLESAIPSVINRAIFGGSRPQSAAQGPALTTITNVGAQESQGSGSIQANAGALLPSLISGARSLLKTPAGQLALGGGAGAALSFMSPDGKKMRITRKMKSQARTVLNIAGGNISVAADILNISEEMLITILLKRFRNDGPVVTKAALRKTKSTIRRLHSMQDVLKSITPTAAGRRRAPMKRAMSTTLIKN